MRLSNIHVLALFSTTLALTSCHNDAATPDLRLSEVVRPIEAKSTLLVEEMTWLEVRDAIAAGFDTLLIPTGGVEQNGPYVVTGKHNFISEFIAEKIAHELGSTLVYPVVRFVPEGEFDPPTLHMPYPGTIGLRVETFENVMLDIARSARISGFKRIILLGDSYQNQEPLARLARKIGPQWQQDGVTVHFVPEYYNYQKLRDLLKSEGIVEASEGIHDDIVFSAILSVIHPEHIRFAERLRAGKTSINGVSLLPLEHTQALGTRLIDLRVRETVRAIQALP